MNDETQVYKIGAQVISDVYITVRARSEEEALEFAETVDGGSWIQDTDGSGYESGDFEINSYATEIDPDDDGYDDPMFDATEND